MSNNQKPSRRLSRQDASLIKGMLSQGYYQNRIAAFFDVNPGRISEIKTGKVFADVLPATKVPTLH